MSNIGKIRNYLQSDRNRTALIGALIILVIVLGVGVFSFFLGRNNPKTVNSPIPVIDLAKISQSGQKVLGAQIFNWSGTVLTLGDGTLTVQSSDGGKKISVITDERTALTRWDLAQPPAAGAESSKTPIAFGEIKPGQQVLVKSSADLSAESEVTADSVTVLVTPSEN